MKSVSYTPDLEIIDGTIFELRPMDRYPTNAEWVCLRKNRNLANRYLALAEEFRGCRMIEVGVDQGGSTAYFTKLFKPEKLLAIELSEKPVRKITRFLSNHDKEGRVEIQWGVDQSDRNVVPGLVDRAFGSQSIDLVVDDASHLLAPSTATFEMLFPRLRPGGRYVVEDWCGDHAWERNMQLMMDRDVDGELTVRFAAEVSDGRTRATPTSFLVCQLVIAVSRRPDWVAEVQVIDGYCEVRRGPAEIPPHTPLADYIGSLGHWMFENHLA